MCSSMLQKINSQTINKTLLTTSKLIYHACVKHKICVQKTALMVGNFVLTTSGEKVWWKIILGVGGSGEK